MCFDQEFADNLQRLISSASGEKLDMAVTVEICRSLKISRMYFERHLGEEYEYKNRMSSQGANDEKKDEEKVVVFDDGDRTDLKLDYPYFREGEKFIHGYVEFRRGLREENLDIERIRFFSELMHLLLSRQNMREYVEYSENSDALTGIPNIVFLAKKYREVSKRIPHHKLLVLRINLQNFKYVNDAAGARAGDEAIIQYSRKIMRFVNEDEGVCRLGGDNFVIFIRKENTDIIMEKMSNILISNLKAAPGRNFNIRPWIGVSEVKEGQQTSFTERLNDASAACDLAKGRYRRSVVYFNDDLVETISRNRSIISNFRPALQRHEFHSFFQPKIDMRTGFVVGLEALCRWLHDGRFVYPDQFISVLDANSLIQELDIVIFAETCSAIRQWQNMGLYPPRVSSNFSKKNLYVPGIEEKILEVVHEYNLLPDDIEIEITESVKDTEYERMIEFVSILKKNGIHVSIDDFGTGYSSLSLLHNIDVDTLKIDRSFVSKLPDDYKSRILIESIVNIASRLNISVIAEGLENIEQGKALLEMGCNIAQGYYFSKPVDFDEASRMIEHPVFKSL